MDSGANGGGRAAVPAHTTLFHYQGRPFDVLHELPHLPPELWDDIFMPREIRAGWQPVIDAARAAR